MANRVQSQAEWIIDTYGKDCQFFKNDNTEVGTLKGAIVRGALPGEYNYAIRQGGTFNDIHVGLFLLDQILDDAGVGGTITSDGVKYSIQGRLGSETSFGGQPFTYLFLDKVA